jgi:hypothetical protein
MKNIYKEGKTLPMVQSLTLYSMMIISNAWGAWSRMMVSNCMKASFIVVPPENSNDYGIGEKELW